MKERETVKLLILGDVMIHSKYNDVVAKKGPPFLFDKVSPKMKESDVRFANIETVLSDKGKPVRGKLCLRGDSRYIKALGEVGLHVVSLANNHAFDFGIKGFTDMKSRLESLGIKTVGAGASLSQSRQLKIISCNGVRIGFLAYAARDTDGAAYATEDAAGVAPLEEDFVLEDIGKYLEQVDHLIVSLHWGVEYAEYPTPVQVALGRKIIDAGARMIIGHHPHILQGYEEYHNGYIFYSLGNFCDSDLLWQGDDKTYQSTLKIADRETMLVLGEFTKTRAVRVECIPLWLNDEGQPEICGAERKESIEEKLERRSQMILRPDFDKFWAEMIVEKRVVNAIKIWLHKGSFVDKIKNFKASQFKTLWELAIMSLQAKFTRGSSKYHLMNPGKDKKPRPFCGDDN